jgi:hypothetical protein
MAILPTGAHPRRRDSHFIKERQVGGRITFFWLTIISSSIPAAATQAV